MRNAADAFTGLGLAVALLLAPTRASALDVDLSRVRIVISSKAPATAQLAAEELKRHLKMIADWKEGESGVCFVLERPPNEPKAAKDTAFAAVTNGAVYFWGDDSRRVTRQPAHGTLFAVYGFLEEVLGVRWVAPGDEGIVFTPRSRVTVRDDWRYSYRPPLRLAAVRDYGEGRLLSGNAFVPEALRLSESEAKAVADDRRLWALRLRLQTRERFKYGHAFRSWQEKYLAEHSDYFGLNPYGTRGLPGKKGAECVKLCLSNEAVLDQILTNWVATGTAKYLNVCPNDGTPGYCFCPKCRALDADLPGERFHAHKTDRYLNFWNRLAAKAVAIRPDVQLVTYIYSYYRFPPRRERIRFPESMYFGFVPSMNDDLPTLYEGWRAAGLRHFFYRPNYLCYRGQVPRGLERWLYDDFRRARSMGADGADYDGRLGRWTQALEYYVVGRMLAFPEKTFDEICTEFYSQYGAAAPVARAVFERIRQRGEKAQARLAERMTKAGRDVLDDGELSAFQVNGQSAADLAEDAARLVRADLSQLTSAERRRFHSLILRTQVAERVVRFLSAKPGTSACEAAARELLEFRKVHRAAIPEEYGNIVRDTELAQWKRTNVYRCEVTASGNAPGDPAAGWRASFDAPGRDGLGDWTPGAAFESITDAEASFDKYSVRGHATARGDAVISRRGIPVTGGGSYRLSLDAKFTSDAVEVRLTVRADEARNRQELTHLLLRRTKSWWVTDSVEFEVPDDVASVSIGVTAKSTSGKGVFHLDNLVFERIGKGKEK